MLDSRYYTKSDPNIDPAAAIGNKNTHLPQFDGHICRFNNPVYLKPEATILPNAFIVVFSGGTNREHDYFRMIEYNPSLYPDIKIEFLSNNNFEKGGKPSIIKFAIDKKNEFEESSNKENPDLFYLLTDVDHFKKFLNKIRRECIENGIECIISNSCFEVWLYYAEKVDKCVGFRVPENENQISSKFKTWANEQVKGGLNPTKAILKIEQNIINAKNNYLEKDGIPQLFSTQMYILAEKILPFVKKGNMKITQRNKHH